MEVVTKLGCKECGSFKDNHNCVHCHKPVCPNHRSGFGEADYYFCSMACTVEHMFPTPKKKVTKSQVWRWVANGMLAASLLYLLHNVVCLINELIHR